MSAAGVSPVTRVYLAVAFLIVAVAAGSCKSSAKKANCKNACARLIELAKADIETSLRGMPKDMADKARPKLMAMVEASAASDRATCEAKCKARSVDTKCIMSAKTFDGASACLAGKTADVAAVDRMANKRSAPNSWIGSELRPTKGTLGKLAFEISLPEGLKPDTGEGFVRFEVPGSPWGNPGFHLSLEQVDMPGDNQAALKIVDPPGSYQVLRNEAVGKRHVVVYRNKKGTYVHANVLIPTGRPKQLLRCYGTQSSAAKRLKLGPAGEWFTKVCMTTKISPRTGPFATKFNFEGGGDEPDVEAVKRVVRTKTMPALSACLSKTKSVDRVGVVFNVGVDGHVSDALVTKTDDKALKRCLISAISAARFASQDAKLGVVFRLER